MEWQPVETAPKDGTWVLLCGGRIRYGWDGDTEPPVVCAQWTVNALPDYRRWQFAWYDSGYYGEYEKPTHWMTPPQPPQGGA